MLVCLDRDGTINKDEDYYLGSADNWKEQIEFLPGVVQGIQLLNTIARVVIITNQSGVALGRFDERRMHEVNTYIIDLLERQGAHIDTYVACPYVDHEYAATRKVDRHYVANHPDIKPRTGMINKVAKPHEDIYVIGDRLSDIQLAHNAGGIGILVPGFKTGNDIEQVKTMPNVYIADTFVKAAQFIVGQSRSAGDT